MDPCEALANEAWSRLQVLGSMAPDALRASLFAQWCKDSGNHDHLALIEPHRRATLTEVTPPQPQPLDCWGLVAGLAAATAPYPPALGAVLREAKQRADTAFAQSRALRFHVKNLTSGAVPAFLMDALLHRRCTTEQASDVLTTRLFFAASDPGAMESTQWALAAVAAEAGCPLPLDQRLVVCEAVPGAVIVDDRPTSAS